MSVFDRLPGYLATGGAAAVVDLGLFWLFTQGGMAIVPAAAGSFLAAAFANYRLSAAFVFHQPASLAGFLRFLTAALLGLAINVGVTAGLVAMLGVAPLLGKVGGIGTAFIVNYLLNVVLVFRRPDAD